MPGIGADFFMARPKKVRSDRRSSRRHFFVPPVKKPDPTSYQHQWRLPWFAVLAVTLTLSSSWRRGLPSR
ncbi:MAG: hypothetical protein ACK56F_05850 [bacterium]